MRSHDEIVWLDNYYTPNHERLADYYRKTATARATYPGWFEERKRRGLQLLNHIFQTQKPKRNTK